MSMRKAFVLLTLGALPWLVACGREAPRQAAAPAAAPTPAAAAPAAPAGGGTGSITGKISFEGTVPPGEKVKLSADPKCQQMHPQGMERRAIQVKDGGLANVLVYVKSTVSGSYPAPAEPVLLDQNGCNYAPHVIVLQVGQKLKIRNSDDTLHNIHPRPTVNQEFNVGQPKKGMETERSFDKTEIMFPVGCDVHPWMRAFMAVVPHPFYAVTGENGSFEIKGLPAGDYEIEAIHEKLKSQTAKVTVKAGEPAKLDLTYKG